MNRYRKISRDPFEGRFWQELAGAVVFFAAVGAACILLDALKG